MSRSLSSLMRSAVRAQETSQVLLALVTITHASIIGGPLRLVQDMQDLTSNGNVYTAFPFRITLPEEGSEAIPRVSLAIDNVSQEVLTTLKSISPEIPPTITIDIVLASQPNTIEFTIPSMTLRSISADMLVIEGDLRMDEEDLIPFPEGSFTPQHFPGLFS